MDTGRGEDGGEVIQELESGELQGGAAGGIGLREDMEDLVGVAADEVEPFERKRRPSTIPDEPFQSGSVSSLDANAGVQAKTATVIPEEHVFSLMGLQQAMTPKVA